MKVYTDHPDAQPGEVFLGRFSKFAADNMCWRTKRTSETGSAGEMRSNPNIFYDVFVHRAELEVSSPSRIDYIPYAVAFPPKKPDGRNTPRRTMRRRQHDAFDDSVEVPLSRERPQ